MSEICLRSILVSLLTLAAAPLQAQAPGIELEGYYARPTAGLIETAALPTQPSCTTVCALPAPDLDPIAGTDPRTPSTAREEMDAIHFTARAPHLPRSKSWDTYR